MRTLLYLTCVLAVMGLAFWAYRENYRTQAALDDMHTVQGEIAQLRDDLGVLNAEWAFLNRPERLRELVSLNFDRLKLVPLDASQFIAPGQIDYPRPVPVPPAPLTDAAGNVLDPALIDPASRIGRPPLRPRPAAAPSAPATTDEARP